jgi:probable HAF family extracellular repeat protein
MKCYSSVVSVYIVLFLSSLAAGQSYSVANVGTASPRAIDSDGNVAGVFETSKKPRQTHAFYWTKKGGFQDLGTLGGNGDDSAAFGINASGQVVGQANSSPGAPDQAFLWSARSGMVDLGNLGGPSSVANAVNESGEVAGQSDLSSGFTNGFLWTSGGGLQSIGILQGGQQSGANAINASGQIAGWANVNSNDDAIIWTADAGLMSLGITARCGATAFGINDSAEVVGWFNNSPGCTFTSHGFSWNASTGFEDLGILPGAQYSFAYGVNSAGQIVGTGDSPTSSTVALLWTADGVLQDLNTLIPSKSTRTLISANAINDAGQIVADANAKNGAGHYAVLLTPIMNTLLGSSENPSQAGQTVTFAATVQSIAGPPPSGEQVNFFSGATLLGGAPLVQGVASFTTSTLVTGTHKIVAIYEGDAIYASSKSPILAQVVTK